MKKDLIISSSIHSYICGIAKFICLDEIKKSTKHRTEDIEILLSHKIEYTPESELLDKNKIEILHKILKNLGKNCKEVLMYWANNYSMIEIAKMMKYQSDKMARKKKYQCFKQLLQYLQDNPQIKDHLK